MNPPSEMRRKFPDSVLGTKVLSDGAAARTIQVRTCRLVISSTSGRKERSFSQGTVRLGSMQDNDLVLAGDDTISRYHCRIIQEEAGYLLLDLHSTNGVLIDGVRVREAYLHSGCTITVGETEIQFFIVSEKVPVVPSQKNRLLDIVGQNERMRELYAVIEKIAASSTTVIIEGETGTGKEVVAQTIHKLSPRAGNTMMVFDCGAVPKNLIESELFGHEKGSFTGAIMTRQGLFELAHGSTLFLDELGELPADLQPKLLRALEQREIRRVGATRSLKVDVRIIAATNRDLEEEVRSGRFRQDLYYRLSVVRLCLPPLRERMDDVPLLVEHALAEHSYNKLSDGTRKVKRVSPEALKLLQSYGWPGNVRELINAIERAVSFGTDDTLRPEHLPEVLRGAEGARERGTGERSGRGRISAPHPVISQGSGPHAIGTASRGGSHTGLASSGAVPLPVPGVGSGPMLVSAPLDLPFKDAKEHCVAAFERDYLESLLRKNRGNISHAARQAEIDRKYFRKLMRKYDLTSHGFRPDGLHDPAEEGADDED